MSHKIAQARKLGLTGRAADRFGHGGFQSQATSGKAVGTPPSARKVLRSFETPESRDKSNSFLQTREETKDIQRTVDATLAARRRIYRRDFGVARDLVSEFPTSPRQDILKQAAERQAQIRKEELAKIQGESRFFKQQEAAKFVPVLPPISAEERTEMRKTLRGGDPALRKFVPVSQREQNRKLVDDEINNTVPERLQDATRGEINIRRANGETVSSRDVGYISVQVDPLISNQLDRVLDIPLQDPTDEKEIANKAVNDDIAKRAYSGELLLAGGEFEGEVDTPGKQAIYNVFHRAGELQRNPELAKKFLDLEEGEELPHAPLVIPEEFFHVPAEGEEFNVTGSLQQAQGELKFELEGLITEENNRVFVEDMRNFRGEGEAKPLTALGVTIFEDTRVEIPLIGVGTDEDLSTDETKAVFDKWSQALYGVPRDGLNPEQQRWMYENLLEFEAPRGMNNTSRGAVLRMLDKVDPEVIAPEHREEFIGMVNDIAHGQQGVKIAGVPIIGTEMEAYITLMSVVKWPAEMVLFTAGQEIFAKVGEEVGIPPLVTGLIGGIAAATVGRGKLTSMTNTARRAAAIKTPGLPLVVRRGLLPAPAGKISPQKLTQLQVQNDTATFVRQNVRAVEDSVGRIIVQTGRDERRILNSAKRSARAAEAEAVHADKLAFLEVLKNNPGVNVARDLVKTAQKSVTKQAEAAREAQRIGNELENSMANFVSRTVRSAYINITEEFPIIRRLRTAIKKSDDLRPLNKTERIKLDSLNKIAEGKVPSKQLSPKDKTILKAFKDRKVRFLDDPEKEIFTQLSKRNVAAKKPRALTPDEEVLRANLLARVESSKAAISRVSKIESTISGVLNEKARKLILRLVRNAERKAAGVSKDKIINVSPKAIRDVLKENKIPFRRGASLQELTETLFVQAKVAARMAEATPKAQVIKSIKALGRQIAKHKVNIDKQRVKMVALAKDTGEVSGWKKSIADIEDRLMNPRVWGDVDAVSNFGKKKLSMYLDALESGSLDVIRSQSLVMDYAGKVANLGISQKTRNIVGKGLRAFTGSSVWAESVEHTGHIYQSHSMYEKMREITRSRGQGFLYNVEHILKDIDVYTKLERYYTGPVLKSTVKGQKFPHSYGDVISQPELYAKLSEDQLTVIRMVQQSVDDNLLVPERLFGVPTEKLEDVMQRLAQGVDEGFDGFPVKGMSVKNAYWSQYIDADTLEMLTGEKVVGTARGSVQRQRAFLKSRHYPNRMELWNDLVSKSEGRTIHLLPARASMEARFSASGDAIAASVHKTNIIRNLPNSQAKRGEGILTSQVKGFEGYNFSADVANAIRTQMEVMHSNIPARGVRQLFNFLRNTKLALDVSGGIGIQGYFFASQVFTNPLAIPRHVSQATKFAFSENAFREMIAYKLPEITRMQSKGLVLGINPVDLQKVTRNSLGFGKGKTVNVPGKLADIINNATFGRMVTYYKISMAEQYLDIMRYSKAFKGFSKVADSLVNVRKTLGFNVRDAVKLSDNVIEEAVMSAVNNRFGGISQAMIGKGSMRVLAEQLIDIAPNWLRARTNLYVNLFKGNNAERYLALEMIGRELAMSAILSTVLSELLVGEMPNLTNPTKFDWLAVKTPLGVVPLIPSQALMNLFANAGYLLGKGAFDIGTGEDPIETLENTAGDIFQKSMRKLRGRESPAVSLAVEQYTGRNFFGTDITSFKGRARAALLGLIPIFGEDIFESIESGDSIQDVFIKGGIGFAGMSLYPTSPFELFTETKLRLARLLFGDAVDKKGKPRYGPDVTFEELDEIDRDDVQAHKDYIEAADNADAKAEEIGLNSSFDNDAYQEKVKYLHDTGHLLDANGEQGERINNTTQLEDDRNLGNRDLDGPTWIGNHFDKRGNDALAAKVYRNEQGIDFGDKEPVNELDTSMLAYWELDEERYIDRITGAFDNERWITDKDNLFDIAVEEGRKSGGDEKARKVAEVLRPVPKSQAVKNFDKAADINKQVEEMPKYRFLTVEQSEQVDELTEMATGVARVIQESGGSTSVAQVLRSVAEAGVIDDKVAYIALFRQIPELRAMAWNPERDVLVMQNPSSVLYYPSLYKGLSERNKIEFRRTQGDRWFSKLWLLEEEQELSKPEILQGLDIDLEGGSSIPLNPVGFKPPSRSRSGVLGVSTFGELEPKT